MSHIWKWLRGWPHRFAALFRKPQRDAEFAEELESHLQMHIEENLRKGMSSEAARRDALIKLGGLEQTKETYRDQRGMPFLEAVLQDLRYALRMLRRNPGFTSVVVLTLALGIGANTAIFSLMNAVLLQSLPVRNPAELVVVQYNDPQSGHENEDFSYPMYQAFRDKNSVFAGVFCRSGVDFNASYAGQSERAVGEMVSGNYFEVLGVRPWIGRLFTQEDDRVPGAHPLAVLSYGYWQARFGGDTSIIGKEIFLDAKPITVIGVTPPDSYGTQIAFNPQIRVPMMMASVFRPVPANRLQNPRHRWLTIMARRLPGVTVLRAQASIDILYHQVLEEELNGLGSKVTAHDRQRARSSRMILQNGRQGFTHLQAEMERPLILLFSVTGIVLLVACANIANLLLARSAKRKKEVAVRLAIGAGPRRLIRQWLTESVLLGLLGGTSGMLFTVWITAGLIRFLPAPIRVDLKVPMDGWVLGFSLLASVATGLLFGLAPAMQISRSSVTAAMHDQVHLASSEKRAIDLRSALVFAQVALSLPLLIGAGLFLHSLQNLRGIDIGFVKENVFLANLNPSLNGYATDRIRTLYGDLLARVRSLPDVRAASLTTSSPISGSWDQLGVKVEGYQPGQDENMSPNAAVVSPGYFASLGIPFVAGRDFTEQDNAGHTRVVIVNQTFARYFFGGSSPIGKHMTTNDDPGAPLDMEIVGLVEDAKYVRLNEKPRRHFYTPLAQEPRLFDMTLQVRTKDDTRRVADLIRGQVRELDPNLPIYAATTLQIQIDDSLTGERLMTCLSGAFGMLATLLAALGLSGVVAFSVARRTQEIGIRVALGARRGDILRMILSQTALPVGLGLVVGLVGAFALSHVFVGMLYEIRPTDPLTYAAASLLLGGVAGLAAYLPARRASRVDPMTALRYE
jgi:putative ABC transport system permease protein